MKSAPAAFGSQRPGGADGSAVGVIGAALSSSAIPYIAVPPELRKLGVRLGDLARVMRSGRSSFAIVADVGPAGKLGEGSILLAQRLGVPADPRGGGVRDGVRYELLMGSSSERPLSLTEIDSSAW